MNFKTGQWNLSRGAKKKKNEDGLRDLYNSIKQIYTLQQGQKEERKGQKSYLKK